MNPFEVRKIIKKCEKNGERLVIEDLSKRCGVRLHHVHLRMSKDMFECESCGGFPRHWVKGLRLESYFTLWFYNPPKVTDFSLANRTDNLPSFGDMENLRDVEKK